MLFTNNGSASGGLGCEGNQMNLVLNILCPEIPLGEMSNKALNVRDCILGESKGIR